MPKKRVTFSEKLVSDIFEFEKDDPNDYVSSDFKSGVKRYYDSITISTPMIYDSNSDRFIDDIVDENMEDNKDCTESLLYHKKRDSKLDIRLVEGQEKATLTCDGDIKITPFNLNDELDDGHFDSDGNFIFKRPKNLIKDNWLDSVDWNEVKESKITPTKTKPNNYYDENAVISKFDLYNELCLYMEDDETILKAIIRCGKDVNKRSYLDKITEIANLLLHHGDADIYDYTIEMLHNKVESLKSLVVHKIEDGNKTNRIVVNHCLSTNEELSTNNKDPILWEYKWDNSENSQIFGPFTSEQMYEWKNKGFFNAPIYCRRVVKSILNQSTSDDDTSGDIAVNCDDVFYSSDRIDFELYL